LLNYVEGIDFHQQAPVDVVMKTPYAEVFVVLEREQVLRKLEVIHQRLERGVVYEFLHDVIVLSQGVVVIEAVNADVIHVDLVYGVNCLRVGLALWLVVVSYQTFQLCVFLHHFFGIAA